MDDFENLKLLQALRDSGTINENELRFEMLDKYLKEVDQGKKILDDAIEVFDTLNIESKGYMPEELAERLGQLELNDYSAPELKKIFSDMEAEGFKLNPKESAKAEAAEIKAEKQAADAKAKKQKQLDKDSVSVEKAGEMLNTFLNKNLVGAPLSVSNTVTSLASKELEKLKLQSSNVLNVVSVAAEVTVVPALTLSAYL